MGNADVLAQHSMRAILDGSGMTRDSAAARIFGYSNAHADQRTMLLAMGRDEAPGRLDYDAKSTIGSVPTSTSFALRRSMRRRSSRCAISLARLG